MAAESIEERVAVALGDALRHWSKDAPQRGWSQISAHEREWWCARAEYLRILMKRRGLKVVVEEGDEQNG